MRLIIFLFVFLLSPLTALAVGQTTYQARIVKPDGYPLEAVSVNFRFSVLDPTGSCVMYVEDYAAVNMISSKGLISFTLGTGAVSFPASATTSTFTTIFDNSVTSFSCQTPGIYNPIATDKRKIVMQFNDGTGWQTLPAMAINAVPYAMYATKSRDSIRLNNKADTAFVEYATLAGLNCQADEAIKFNGVSFGCIPVSAAGSSGIASVTTSGSVLITAGTASAPVIGIQAVSLSQDGYLTSLDYAEFKAKLSASSTQIVSVLGYEPANSVSLTSLTNTVAASFASITSSQWVTSGTDISYIDGRVGIGTTTPSAPFTVQGHQTNQNSQNNVFSSFLNFNKDRAGSTVQDGDELGQVLASGYNGSDFQYAGLIKFRVQGMVSGTSMPGSIEFATTPVGSNSPLARMYINNLGNVGIGAGTPTAKLQIAAGTSSTAPFKFISGTLLASPQSGTMEYDGAQFYLTDSTNTRRAIVVGSSAGSIDNASVINSTANIAMVPDGGSVIVSATTASTSSNTGALVVSGGLGVIGNIYASGTILTSGRIQGASITATSGVSTNVIQGNLNLLLNPNGGNVGVGTNGPVRRLEVAGDGTNSPQLRLSYTGGSSWLELLSNSASPSYINFNSSTASSTARGVIGYSNSIDYFFFRTAGSTTDRLVVTSSGNVGIGTTAPTQKLEVSGVIQANNGFLSKANGITTVLSADAQGSYLESQGANNLRFFTNGAARIRVDSSGNVGIGSSSPMAALDLGKANTEKNQVWIREGQGGGLDASAGKGLKIEYSNQGDTANIQSYDYATNTPKNLTFQSTGGNVGIGVSMPVRPLQVRSDSNGVIRIDRASSMPAIEFNRYSDSNFLTNWSSWQIGTDATSPVSRSFIIFDNTSGTSAIRMVINQVGNVGVGTENPQSKLQVAGDVKIGGADARGYNIVQDYMSLGETDSGASTILGNNIKVTNGTNNTVEVSANEIDGSKWLSINYVRGFTFNSVVSSPIGTQMDESSGELMRLTPIGNLGVGTANPTRKIHLLGGIKLQSPTPAIGNINSEIIFSSQDNVYYQNTAAIRSYVPADSAGIDFGDLRFYTTNGAGQIDQERMRITPSGNLGIGMTNPTHKLQVVGASGQKIQHSESGNSTGFDFLPDSDFPKVIFRASDNSARFSQTLDVEPSSANDVMAFSSSNVPNILNLAGYGSVGVGTTSPSERLHVVGNLRVQGSTDCTLGNGAGGTNCSSDARLKENIKPIPYALKKINSLKGVEFDWNQKSLSFGRHDIGVIAQDVEKVFPTAVITDRNSGYKRVDYAVLVAPIIQAIKELYGFVENKADKAVIESLKKQNEEKQKEINALKNYLCKKDKEAPFCN